MTGTDFVLIFLIVGYFTSIIRQSWLSTRIDDLKHDNDRLRRDVERDVEVLETEIAHEAGNRRSTCTQWHREANTRLWTLENQHDTAADDLDIPDTDTHSILDKGARTMPDDIRDALTRIGRTIRRAARDLLRRLADRIDPDPAQSGRGDHITINYSTPGYPPDLNAMRDHHRRTRRAGYSSQTDDFYRNR